MATANAVPIGVEARRLLQRVIDGDADLSAEFEDALAACNSLLRSRRDLGVVMGALREMGLFAQRDPRQGMIPNIELARARAYLILGYEREAFETSYHLLQRLGLKAGGSDLLADIVRRDISSDFAELAVATLEIFLWSMNRCRLSPRLLLRCYDDARLLTDAVATCPLERPRAIAALSAWRALHPADATPAAADLKRRIAARLISTPAPTRVLAAIS